jgi:anti-anti-sigma factor
MSQHDALFRVGTDSWACDCVIEAYGDIDADTSSRLAEILEAGLAESPTRLIVDLAGVTSIGSTALQMLAAARKQGRTSGTDLVLRSPSATTVARISGAGLSDRLPVVYPMTTGGRGPSRRGDRQQHPVENADTPSRRD